MTHAERLTLARKISANASALNGDSDDYCKYMEDGAYDDNPIVVAALYALIQGERAGLRAAAPKATVEA